MESFQTLLPPSLTALASPTTLAVAAGGALLTLLLAARISRVRAHRYDKVEQMNKEFAHLLKDPTKMTHEDARKIMLVSMQFDMPRIVSVSLSFALFNTYAIGSISKVLAGSKQLLLPENATRRAEDTGVILAELMAEDGGLDGERATCALSRMNWLHRRYGSRITRDDLLYTLSLFIFVPTEWCAKFEWRPLTELEQEARYVFWREVGARMGITDIPRTRQELWDWQDAYARRFMVFADTNADVARVTTNIFLSPQPAVMRPISRQASVVFLDDRTREAFGLPRAPGWMYWLIPTVLRMRAWCMANLAMPRKVKPRWQEVKVNVGADGKKRIQRQGYLFEPWYASKDAPAGIFGARVKPGEQWLCEGFEIERVGPVHLMSKGNEEVLAAAAQMREKAATCPFFV